jgi:hypothetical protein
MAYKKRILIATILGLIAGLLCVTGGKLMFGMTFTPLALLFVMTSRLMIGFVIGISALQLPWLQHGVFIGLIIGFPFPVYDLITGQGILISFAAFVMSIVFGISIEFVTTFVFKAPMSSTKTD